MKHRRLLSLLLPALTVGGVLLARRSSAEAPPQPLVRLAELEIDPAQVAAYRVALQEEIDKSIRLEPGVLALYAVAIQDHPEQVRLFEMYRDDAAYRSHLLTPHFLRYKLVTAGMVKSLRLLQAEPIRLGAKPTAR